MSDATRRWDKRETERLMAALGRTKNFWTLAPAMRAVTDRLMHAQYHFAECKRLLSEHIDQQLERGDDIWSVSFPASDEAMLAHNIFFVQCGAHMNACAQATHATADIMAHVVFHALGLGETGTWSPKMKVSLYSVADYLKQQISDDETATDLAQVLDNFRAAPAFRAVTGLVNHMKHKGGPRATLALEPADGKPYEMRFEDFVHGEYQPARGIEEWLAPAFEVVNSAVVNIGIALNAYLSRSEQGLKMAGKK